MKLQKMLVKPEEVWDASGLSQKTLEWERVSTLSRLRDYAFTFKMLVVQRAVEEFSHEAPWVRGARMSWEATALFLMERHHPNARRDAAISKALADSRRVEYIYEHIEAIITNLDLSNNYHFWFLSQTRSAAPSSELWNDTELPIVLPDWLPAVDFSKELSGHWDPNINAWDVQDAARHELELHMGGMATVLLHDILTEDKAARAKRIKVRDRVAKYLQRNLASIPDNPWDPNNWGHDSRLKSLVVSDDNGEVPLAPAFDAEVLEYTAQTDLSEATIKHVIADNQASSRPRMKADGTYEIWVFANDHTTSEPNQRVYKITGL